MSFLGQDDGYSGLANARSIAESRVADARRRPARVETSRWPSGASVLRVAGLTLGAIVLIGWILTALNG